MFTDEDCGIERNESKISFGIIIFCCIIAAIFIAVVKVDFNHLSKGIEKVSEKNTTALTNIIINTDYQKQSPLPSLRQQSEKPPVNNMIDPMAFMALVGSNNMVKVQSALQNHKCSDYRDRDDNEALAYITDRTSSEMIDLLIQTGCDINHKNKYDNTPIMFGVHELGLDKIKILIEKGADLSATTRSGRTVISLSGNQETNNYLKSLSNATVPDYLTRVWWREATLTDVQSVISTLLQSDKKAKIMTLAAANVSDPDIISYLMRQGFDLNQSDENGVTAVFAAATSNVHPEILKELYNRGANINSRSKEGMTPIMFAIYFKNIGMIKTLLDLGADLDIKDNTGLKAIDYARQSNSFDIINILLKKIRSNKQENRGSL